ncbi:MAG: hypothetical protein ABJL99_06000 [Aliishimia sp.]
MKLIVFLLALLAPIQAAALSCAPWYVENAFAHARDSEAAYVVVEGTLTFPVDELPKTDWENQAATPPQTQIKARLRGYSLSQDGFAEPFNAPVTLIVKCAGPWCSEPKPGDALAFLKRVDTGYELVSRPCGGFVFAQPTQEILSKVETCFSGGDCAIPQP